MAPVSFELAYEDLENALDYTGNNFKHKVKGVFLGLYNFFSDYATVSALTNTLLAALGVVSSRFWVALLLFEVIKRYPILLDVLQSLYRPWKQFMYVGLVIFITVYCFGFYAYLDDFMRTRYKGACHTLLPCTIFTFDFNWKSDGGTGGYLYNKMESDGFKENLRKGEYEKDTPFELNPKSFIYDNLFNFIITMFLVQIWGGLIIDAFSSLREETEKRLDITENYCFICGNHKDTLEKAGSNKNEGWSHHTKREHNVWAYVFYIAYIRSKPQNDFTGVESEVAAKIEKGDISWFPCNKALVLQNVQLEKEEEDNDKEIIAKEGRALQTRLSAILRRMAKVQKQMSEKKELIASRLKRGASSKTQDPRKGTI